MDKKETISDNPLFRSILNKIATGCPDSFIRKVRTIIILTCFLLLISPAELSGQRKMRQVPSPVKEDFYESMLVLSSAQMEGREAGTKGSQMASDYISSRMKFNGLQPFGDSSTDKNIKKSERRTWFQNFKALTFRDYRDSMILTGQVKTIGADTTTLRNVLGVIYGKIRRA